MISVVELHKRGFPFPLIKALCEKKLAQHDTQNPYYEIYNRVGTPISWEKFVSRVEDADIREYLGWVHHPCEINHFNGYVAGLIAGTDSADDLSDLKSAGDVAEFLDQMADVYFEAHPERVGKRVPKQDRQEEPTAEEVVEASAELFEEGDEEKAVESNAGTIVTVRRSDELMRREAVFNLVCSIKDEANLNQEQASIVFRKLEELSLA